MDSLFDSDEIVKSAVGKSLIKERRLPFFKSETDFVTSDYIQVVLIKHLVLVK